MELQTRDRSPISTHWRRHVTLLLLLSATGIGLWFGLRMRQPSGPPDVAPLVEACRSVAYRVADGRLAGFPWAPMPSTTRGGGEGMAPPDVRIAAAHIEQRARRHESPESTAALGVARLAIGEIEEAVLLLEEATRARPNAPALLTDLSAAYLTRARRLDRPDDLPRALAAAERAITVDPDLPEAYYNRALALESLALRTRAARAWAEFRGVESDGAWLREAVDRERALHARSSASGHAPDNQSRREHIEMVLLRRWAQAWLDGDAATADAALADAATAAAALVKDGGDGMARDAVAAIRRAREAGDRTVLEALAHGHRAYAEAHDLLRTADGVTGAARLMDDAARSFRRAGSPWALWGPIFQAIARWTQGSHHEALRLLEQTPVETLPEDHLHIRGRRFWTEGSVYSALGRYDLARDRYQRALALFARAGAFEYTTVHHMYVAVSAWMLGDRAGAWRHLLVALAGLERLPPSGRRDTIPLTGSSFALDEDLPEAALHLQDTLIDVAHESGLATSLSRAYMQRGLIQARLGRQTAAMADLGLATAAVARVDDRGLRDREVAWLDTTYAEVLGASDPARAIAHADRAITWARENEFGGHLATLLTLRARAHVARGDETAAAADLRRAIGEFERERGQLQTLADRISAFDGERRAYDDLFRLELRRGNRDEALRVLERSLAGGLDMAGGPVDPLTAHTRLPDDVAFVYLAAQPPRPVLWVLTRDGAAAIDVALDTGELARAADRVRGLILDGAGFDTIAPAAAPLVDAIVAPMLRAAGGRRTIAFVPDGPLLSLPVGLLPDGGGWPLVASRRVLTATSLSAFLSASARLRSFEPGAVLAVGDGHRPEDSGLPRLPHADVEAREVARIYPAGRLLVGGDASPARLLEREEPVLHFAGHAVANQRLPVLSRLLLAPDPPTARAVGITGELSGAEILARRFTRTRVVVLGACEGAAGRMVDGDGVLSLATLFLHAGAGSVIASYWPVEDQVHPVLIALHRELRRQRDPAAALRAAQLDVLAAAGRDAPVRLWGAFVAIGGLVPDPGGES
ncbi:MAG TPA: CHAT domain-containing protein [Vicinamibacterales bacterium]